MISKKGVCAALHMCLPWESPSPCVCPALGVTVTICVPVLGVTITMHVPALGGTVTMCVMPWESPSPYVCLPWETQWYLKKKKVTVDLENISKQVTRARICK